MMRSVCLAMLVASALSGCVNLAPDHVRPELSTSAEWTSELRPDGTLVASTLAWEDYFRDPRLRFLIAEALQNNRDLVAATARVEQARARYRIQDSERLPAVGVEASATRSRAALTGERGVSGTITANRYDVRAGVSAFELDFWGRVANLSEAARARYLATEATQRAFYLSLIAEVANTYFETIEAEEQIALAEATASSRQEELHIAKLRLDAGVTSGLPYRQAESLLTQAQQQLAAERQTEALLRNRLTVLIGGRLTAPLPPKLSLGQQYASTRLAAGLPSDLLHSRPDIQAAEESLRAARADIGAARAAFFPSISLTGSGGFVSGDLDTLFGADGLTWSFSPAISLPIFDWGARQGNLDLAKAVEVEAVANYDATVQNAFREVADGLAGRRWLADQLEAERRNIVALEQIARIARLRYREGVADYLEVLDAERNLFSARQQLLATGRAYQQNAANLYVALGGGFGARGED